LHDGGMAVSLLRPDAFRACLATGLAFFHRIYTGYIANDMPVN